MARPAKWNSPTESVRLPAHLIPRLIELAQVLDQPIAETETDQDFQEYASFVQNLKPILTTITGPQGEKRYLIDPEIISFEEFKLVKEIESTLIASLEAEGLNRPQDRLFVFSRMVEAWGTPVNLNKETGRKYAN